MVGLTASLRSTGIVANLSGMASRCKSNAGPFLAYAGRRTAIEMVPKTIKQNVPNWPNTKNRPGGRPLYDTGYLASHVAYQATERSVSVYTNVSYGKILQDGATLRRGRRGGRGAKIRAYKWLTWRREYLMELDKASGQWFWRGVVQRYPMTGGNPGSGRR